MRNQSRPCACTGTIYGFWGLTAKRLVLLVSCLLAGMMALSGCATSRRSERFVDKEWLDDVVQGEPGIQVGTLSGDDAPHGDMVSPHLARDVRTRETAERKQYRDRDFVEQSDREDEILALRRRNEQLEAELALLRQQHGVDGEDPDDDTASGPRNGGSSRGLFGRFRRGSEEEAVTRQKDVSDTPAHRVHAGDEIHLTVFREPDFSGVFRVDASGHIRHPFMGSFYVERLTIREVEEKIHGELAARYLVDPRVVVTVNRTQQQERIVLLGEVRKPGVYPYPVGATMTLLEAIANAGGFTDMASVDRVRLVRTSNSRSESLRIRVSRLLDGREPDVDLQPNDVITVPEVRF